jgi:hypothetical protein
MTAAILPPSAAPVHPLTTFDQAAFDTAVERAERDCASRPRWLRAVKKAAEHLRDPQCPWQFDPRTQELLITSATDHTTRYTVRAGSCPCPADSICWHRAARRLLILAGEIATERTQPSQPRKPYAEVCAAADELYR